MLGWISALKAAISVGSEVYRWVREYERYGVARLSPRWADRDRRRLERLGLWLHEGRNKGIRRYITVDDAAAGYIQRVLKSTNLDIVLTGTTTAGREQARAAILVGADRDPTEWSGPAGDRAQP